MTSSRNTFSAKPFSHIYYEQEALNYQIAKDIISHFPEAHLIPIDHYKDMFNRPNQNYMFQKNSTALILAVNHGEMLYPGAKVCQSFGNDHFYYSSVVKNCIFDCEYCYLQGLYPSANIVIFVNLKDVFEKVTEILKEHSMYICISYDTDLWALEGLCHYVNKWTTFAAGKDNLKIEIRTKAANLADIEKLSYGANIIFAWTLSPDGIIKDYENRTPCLDLRIKAIKRAIELGCTVRLCFDPMLYVNNYQEIYSSMYEKVFTEINADDVLDVSIGLFRISADYIKNMKKKRASLASMYPYDNIDGVCSYDIKRSDEMLDFAESCLLKYLPKNKIYATDY